MNIEGKVALVTGGTKGIGAAAAIMLAQRGADVAINGRHHDDEAAAVINAIESHGRRALMIEADVAQPEDATQAVQQTIGQLGGIDILIHSAGGLIAGGLMDLSTEQWMYGFDVHVHAMFHLCRAAIPRMKQAGEATIILVSSVAGIRGCATHIGYQAVKGVLPQMTRALAFEFGDDNIRVNCVAPGIVETAFHADMPADVRKHNMDNRIPLHRFGKPDDVATLICELVANDFMTGETVVIDGGTSMRVP